MLSNSARLPVGLLTASEFWSSLGLQVIMFVAPVVAIQSFHASPFEVGVLNLAEPLAALLFGFGIGRAVDRYGGASSITVANVVRMVAAALLASTLLLGPSMSVLYLTTFLIGIASFLNDAGTTTAIVENVGRSGKALNRANSLLRTSAILSSLAGPGLAGFILAAASVVTAVFLGAVGFAIAAACSFIVIVSARAIDRPSKDPVIVDDESFVDDAPRKKSSTLAGIGFIWRHAFLRRVVGSSMHFNFFSAAFQAVFLIYCLREVRLEIWSVAIIGVATGIGGILGAIFSSSSFATVNSRHVYASAITLPALSVLVMLSAEAFAGTAVAATLIAVANAAFAFCMVVCVVLFNTARQVSSPNSLMGQIAAAERMIAIGGEVPGAIVGGVIGTLLSVEHSMWFALTGMAFTAVWLRKVREWPHGDEIPRIATS